MTSLFSDPADFGWTQFFESQLTEADRALTLPVRVMGVHRGQLDIAAPGLARLIPSRLPQAAEEEDYATVGDWLLIDRETLMPRRVLSRKSLFKRRAAGTGRRLQLIAANVDTLFIVSSCNQDFNLPRIERYLVLAGEADVFPVLVLTKADMTDAPEDFARAARTAQRGLIVETVNALDPDALACLAPWCGRGQTVALLGSSGVGKSTLVNTLSGGGAAATQGIREDDAKGRHTTTARALHPLSGGGWLLDTPGMRELQLTDAAAGLEDVFGDILSLASSCRFSDCRHEAEPGCAVRAALEAGILEPGRLSRWRKLVAEEAHNSESLAQRRSREKAFGKMARRAQAAKQQTRRTDRD